MTYNFTFPLLSARETVICYDRKAKYFTATLYVRGKNWKLTKCSLIHKLIYNYGIIWNSNTLIIIKVQN